MLQAKLLRVLQEKELIRVGGDRVIPVDVRIIASSNEDIHELVRQGRFRKDLFYRLNTLPLEIPPLRERGEDLFLIAAEIKKRFGYAYILAPDAREILRRYCWEGNVRELSNLIEYLAVVDKPEITSEDLPHICGQPRLLSPEVPSSPMTFRTLRPRRQDRRSCTASCCGRCPQQKMASVGDSCAVWRSRKGFC